MILSFISSLTGTFYTLISLAKTIKLGGMVLTDLKGDWIYGGTVVVRTRCWGVFGVKYQKHPRPPF
jgi:hypothetical protein